MKKKLLPVLVMLFLPTLAAAQSSELRLGGNIWRGSNHGFGSSVFSGIAGGQIAVRSWDFGGDASLSTLPKLGTPGGHQTTYSAFARQWFGPNFFVSGDAAWAHADATVWTKDVTFVGGTAGVRWRTRTGRVRPDEDVVYVSYDHEIKTDAVAPNRTRVWTAGWRHDWQLNGVVAIRGGLAFSYTRFLQNGDWWTGKSFSVSTALVLKGRG